MCSYNNNKPVSIPSLSYVLINRSILCNYNVEAESNFLLESLVACGNSKTKTDLMMYFTVNVGFLEAFEINAGLLNAP